MIKIERCKDIESPEYREAMDIYAYSFPDSERRPEFLAKQLIIEDRTLLFVMKLDKRVIGMVFITPVPETGYLLFDYFAIAKEFRQKGYGDIFINFVVQLASEQSKKLILEAENPKFGENTQERISRINFYIKRGFKLIERCQYALPDFTGDGPVELCLMTYCLDDNLKIEGKEIKDVIESIYLNLYNRKGDDIILQRIKNSTGESLNLSSIINLELL